MPRASLGWRSTSSGPPENVPVPSRLELPLRVALASEAWPSEVYAPFALPAAAARYVFGVHRARVGSRLRLLDGASREADAEVLDPSNGLVRIVEVFLVERSTRRVVLLQGAPKADKMDAIVRDGVELGATSIGCVLTERAVAHPRAERLERWQRVAVEAARQCGRGEVPELWLASSVRDAVLRLGAPLGPGETGGLEVRAALSPHATASFGDTLVSMRPLHLALLVGPEGGLTDAELTVAHHAGFDAMRLGRWVMRTETVCAAALGAFASLGTEPSG